MKETLTIIVPISIVIVLALSVRLSFYVRRTRGTCTICGEMHVRLVRGMCRECARERGESQ